MCVAFAFMLWPIFFWWVIAQQAVAGVLFSSTSESQLEPSSASKVVHAGVLRASFDNCNHIESVFWSAETGWDGMCGLT